MIACAAARRVFLSEVDDVVHHFIEDIMSSSALLGDQSLVIVVSDHGTVQEASTVSAQAWAHATQPLLWMATSHRMVLVRVQCAQYLPR